MKNKLLFAAAAVFLLSWPGAYAQNDYRIGSATVSIEPGDSVFSLTLAGYGAPREGRFSIDWEVAASTPETDDLANKIAQTVNPAPATVPSPAPPAEVISLAGERGNYYALCADSTLWQRKYTATGLDWVKIGRYNGYTWTVGIERIALSEGRLYGLGHNGRLYAAVHRSDGNLSAGALAVRKGRQTTVIASVDLCGIDYSLAADVKEAIFRDRGIPPEAILINSSHTHFAPVAQQYPAFGHGHLPDSTYLNNTVKKGLITCIENALDNMSPAALYFGRGRSDIGHNRTSSNRETPYDQTLDVLKVQGRNENPSALLFLTGCHPVFRNEQAEGYTISANFPGVARQLLDQATGAGNIQFLQGCAGDINPREADHRVTGKQLAGEVMDVLNGDLTRVRGKISYSLDTIEFPIQPWPEARLQAFRAENEGKTGDLEAERNVRWADRMLRHYRDRTLPGNLPVYVQIVTIGNWKLVGLSREVVTEYGPAIRAVWPDELVSVAGYCNDVSSYLPHDWHLKARTYEGHGSFFWYGQAGIFPAGVMRTIVESIRSKSK